MFEIAQGTRPIIPLGSFNGTNGNGPEAGVVLDSSGNAFGTTYGGGLNGTGAVFEVVHGTTSITPLASFIGTNGEYPRGGVAINAAGDIFGTTTSGGAHYDGAVFEIAHGTTSVTPLASFNYTNGEYPQGDLTLDSSGNLFGTTEYGGASGYGTVFEIANGSTAISTVASFNNSNGAYPQAGVTIDPNGNLFGTTYQGGTSNQGTVFEIAHGTNSITTLATFNTSNGKYPEAGVTLDSSGDLFGTTYQGGANSDGTVFEIVHGTTAITTIASFNGDDGANPQGGVTLDSSGDLFGTAYAGGIGGTGAVFEIAAGTTAIVFILELTAPHPRPG